MREIDPQLTVLKVGGSLLTWSGLRSRLAGWLSAARSAGRRVTLLAGGGELVDAVRRLDESQNLGDDAAHDLAIRALDVTAQALRCVLDDWELRVESSVLAMENALRERSFVIVAPANWLAADERASGKALPRSWDVTSDTISVRLARRLGATELVLAKSARAPRPCTIDEAVRLGLVDPYFADEACAIARLTYWDARNDEVVGLV